MKWALLRASTGSGRRYLLGLELVDTFPLEEGEITRTRGKILC